MEKDGFIIDDFLLATKATQIAKKKNLPTQKPATPADKKIQIPKKK